MALISTGTTIGGRSAARSHRVRRWWQTQLPARRFGAVRTVFITRRYVFKLPGRWQWQHRRWWWNAFLRGLLSNMQERSFAAEHWPELCPLCFSAPGGFLVVMPRARPLTYAEWQHFDYRAFVTRGDEYVADNFDSYAGNVEARRARSATARASPWQRRAVNRARSSGMQAGQLRRAEGAHRRRRLRIVLWLSCPRILATGLGLEPAIRNYDAHRGVYAERIKEDVRHDEPPI
jgi:hypothetical protein